MEWRVSSSLWQQEWQMPAISNIRLNRLYISKVKKYVENNLILSSLISSLIRLSYEKHLTCLNHLLRVISYKRVLNFADSAGFGGTWSGWAIFKRAFKSCQRRWSTVKSAVPYRSSLFMNDLKSPLALISLWCSSNFT